MAKEKTSHLYIVLISFEVLLNGSTSLKIKRSVINRIKDRVRSRFNASIAEIGYLDKWQRAEMAITMVCNERKRLQQDIHAIEQLLTGISDVVINNLSTEWIS